MRHMSFSKTTEQVRARTKTVTRRKGWKNLKPGTVVKACVKCQGLKLGEKVEVICEIRITSNRTERLSILCERLAYGREEAHREGFPHLDGKGFVQMFVAHMGGDVHQEVQRIEFEYVT